MLRNLRIKNKDSVMKNPQLSAASKEAENILAGKGRMLIRPSGTEPLIRIFAEARDPELMNKAVDILEKRILEIIDSED